MSKLHTQDLTWYTSNGTFIFSDDEGDTIEYCFGLSGYINDDDDDNEKMQCEGGQRPFRWWHPKIQWKDGFSSSFWVKVDDNDEGDCVSDPPWVSILMVPKINDDQEGERED